MRMPLNCDCDRKIDQSSNTYRDRIAREKPRQVLRHKEAVKPGIQHFRWDIGNQRPQIGKQRKSAQMAEREAPDGAQNKSLGKNLERH